MHYIAVLVPAKGGGWSVIFPDLPGYGTHGPTVHDAITTASGAASSWLYWCPQFDV
jgi:predicted RNase H-like HicB family nuclease